MGKETQSRSNFKKDERVWWYAVGDSTLEGIFKEMLDTQNALIIFDGQEEIIVASALCHMDEKKIKFQ